MPIFKKKGKTIPQNKYRIVKIGKDAIYEILREYIIDNQEVEVDDSEYDEDNEYSEEELYTGNVFEDLEDEDEKPVTLNDFFKRKFYHNLYRHTNQQLRKN